MTRTIEVKMAKPSKDDQRKVFAFMQFLESVFEYREYPDPNDPDASTPVKDDGEAFGRIEDEWDDISAAWTRVLLAGEVAIDNACDPALDVLDFKPEIVKAMGERQLRRELLSEIADLASRIGVAAAPEWVRGRLERIANETKYRAE